jgi:hypothetical protein
MLPKSALLVALALVAGWSVPAARAQQVPPASGNSSLSLAPSPTAAPPDGPLFDPAPEARPDPSVADARPFRPPAGWFAAASLFLTRPHSVVPGDFWGPAPPEAVPDLGTTISPLATLGYRFTRDNALLVSYRYLASAAEDDTPHTGFLQGHAGLTSHWVDLDYRGCLHGPWLWFTFQWQTGCRLAAIDYDVRSVTHYESGDRHSTFFGAGPHFGIDLNWYLGPTGLGVFGRADLGLAIGRGALDTTTHLHSYGSVVVLGPADFQDHSASTMAPVSGVTEVGLSWTPATQRWLRFEGGLQVFYFSMVESRDFGNGGPFLRCEVGF